MESVGTALGPGSFIFQVGKLSSSGGTSTDGSHSHGYTPSGSVSSSFSGSYGTTSYDGNSSNYEARPSNYTYVIWKRVS